jgi:hypothetical protein
MRRQAAPTINDTQALTNIIEGKHKKTKTRLNAIKLQVLGAYDTFTNNVNNLGEVTPLPVTDEGKEDLKGCYTSETKALKKLKGSIVLSLDALSRIRCPYCGYREPTSFDHYLPKTSYAEFSVYSKNLLWVCHPCNHKKHDNFSAASRVLHTYYDTIPNDKFLFCTLSPPFNATSINFFVQKPALMSNAQYKILGNHFVQLELAQSYIREAGLVFSTWMKEWRTMLAGRILTKLQVSQIVAVQVASRIDDYGRNHYEVALLEAILEQIDALFPEPVPRVRKRIDLED